MARLTYEQKYEVDFKVQFADRPVTIEYAACGSHESTYTGTISLEEARKLRDYLNTLPGIDGDDD